MTTVVPAAINDLLTHDGRPILAIEYHDGRPFAVITDYSYFSFEYCRRDDSLQYLDTGSGLRDNQHFVARYCHPEKMPCQLWLAPGIQCFDYVPETNCREVVVVQPDELPARGYQLLAEPLELETWSDTRTRNPFDVAEPADGNHEYCSICEDYLPCDSLCNHLYAPDCGSVLGAGGDRPSEESLFAALDWLATVPQEFWQEWKVWPHRWHWEGTPLYPDAVTAMERLLSRCSVERHGVPPHCLEGHFLETFPDPDGTNSAAEDTWGDCEAGLGWLTTLGPDTPRAIAWTLARIMDWRASRVERAKAKELTLAEATA